MRKLTKHETENKPWWAKSYDIQAQHDTPIFYITERGGAMPIPRKEFDISKHEFSDRLIDASMVIGDEVLIRAFNNGITMKKQDAIALAKHFKLTAEDLR